MCSLLLVAACLACLGLAGVITVQLSAAAQPVLLACLPVCHMPGFPLDAGLLEHDRRLNSSQGVANASLLAAQRDESATTGILACAKEALQNIHGSTFQAMRNAGAAAAHGKPPLAWHAASVMEQQRSNILSGVTLMFAKCTLPLKVPLLPKHRHHDGAN
jgi:hypothetical protein